MNGESQKESEKTKVKIFSHLEFYNLNRKQFFNDSGYLKNSEKNSQKTLDKNQLMCEINVDLTYIVIGLSSVRNFENMKVTKKGDYALRALVDLALNYDKGVRHIQDIAREEAIPQKFLEQILILLKNADLIQSRRGVKGGYFLSRPPNEISLGEVIRRIDGPLAPLDCASKSSHMDCPREGACGIRSVMLDVENATVEIMDRVTLEDVCKRTKGTAERRSEHLMYHI